MISIDAITDVAITHIRTALSVIVFDITDAISQAQQISHALRELGYDGRISRHWIRAETLTRVTLVFRTVGTGALASVASIVATGSNTPSVTQPGLRPGTVRVAHGDMIIICTGGTNAVKAMCIRGHHLYRWDQCSQSHVYSGLYKQVHPQQSPLSYPHAGMLFSASNLPSPIVSIVQMSAWAIIGVVHQ